MALSENSNRNRANSVGMQRFAPVIETGSKCYQGSFIVTNASGTAQPAANDGTTMFVGMSTAEVASGDGTLTVECITNLEVKVTCKTGVTIGNIGDAAYAFDDEVVTNLTTRGAEIGVISQFTSITDAWVMLGQKALRAGA